MHSVEEEWKKKTRTRHSTPNYTESISIPNAECKAEEAKKEERNEQQEKKKLI